MSRHTVSQIERQAVSILENEAGPNGLTDTELLRALGAFRGEAVRFALANLRRWKVVELFGYPARWRLRRSKPSRSRAVA